MQSAHKHPSALSWQAAFVIFAAVILESLARLFVLYRAMHVEDEGQLWQMLSLPLGGILALAIIAGTAAGLIVEWSMERRRLRGLQPAWPAVLVFGAAYLVIHTIVELLFGLWLSTQRVLQTSAFSSTETLLMIVRASHLLLCLLCVGLAWWFARHLFRRRAVAISAPVNHRLRTALMIGAVYLCLQLMLQSALLMQSRFDLASMVDRYPAMPPLLCLAAAMPAALALVGAWLGLPMALAAVRPGRVLLAAALIFVIALLVPVGLLWGVEHFIAPSMMFAASLLIETLVIPIAGMAFAWLCYRNTSPEPLNAAVGSARS